MKSKSRSDIEVTVAVPDWHRAVTDPLAWCRRAGVAALDAMAIGPHEVEVEVLLTDDDAIRALNREWRGQDRPTNVLSFPMFGPGETRPVGHTPVPLGDIVVALETVLRESREEGKPAEHHLAHLIVHGVLHLLGRDHADDDQAASMEELETRLLAGLGVPDPHATSEASP